MHEEVLRKRMERRRVSKYFMMGEFRGEFGICQIFFGINSGGNGNN